MDKMPRKTAAKLEAECLLPSEGLGIIRTMRGSLEPVTRNVLVEKHDRQGDE
jgi:hypothetical protein